MSPDQFKEKIRERLYKKSINENIDEEIPVAESADIPQSALAGSLVAAGSQKTADAISKMDSVSFIEFVKKIDAEGIAMVTKQFVNTLEVQPGQETNAGAAEGGELEGLKPEGGTESGGMTGGTESGTESNVAGGEAAPAPITGSGEELKL